MVHLGGLRDERKAVLAVSEGWLQYGPNPALARPLKNTDGAAAGAAGHRRPRDRTRREQGTVGAVDLQKCEADRMALANMDNTDRLQRIGERANRVNVTFYPIGAQGLAGVRLGHRSGAAAAAARRTRPTCAPVRTACGCSPT